MGKNNIATCPKCKNKQKLVYEGKSTDNIAQDIAGLYTMCNRCGLLFNVEYYVDIKESL